MTCMEAEKMVIPYINDQLSVTELEDFIEHIKTCENCREELEIHYMVDVGLKKLDEADGTYDIVGDLKRKLESSEAVLRQLLHLPGGPLCRQHPDGHGPGGHVPLTAQDLEAGRLLYINLGDDYGKTGTDRRAQYFKPCLLRRSRTDPIPRDSIPMPFMVF